MAGEVTMPREFLTRVEAADYISKRHFQITARTLATLASNDKGPPYRRFNGRAQYKRSEIEAWISHPNHHGNVAPGRSK